MSFKKSLKSDLEREVICPAEKCKDCLFGYIGIAYDDEVRMCKLQKGFTMLYNDKFPECPIQEIIKLQNQKAIECLKELKEKLKMHCEFTDEDNIGWYMPETKIEIIIDNKIKELEGNNDTTR